MIRAIRLHAQHALIVIVVLVVVVVVCASNGLPSVKKNLSCSLSARSFASSNLRLAGLLHSVDQFLNVKLNNVEVVDKTKYPQLLSVKNCFIRGSVLRYVQISPADVDTELLQDAARREHEKK